MRLLFLYPEPGSNRHELLHWCLRPTRLPIPPSGQGVAIAVQRYENIDKWQLIMDIFCKKIRKNTFKRWFEGVLCTNFMIILISILL